MSDARWRGSFWNCTVIFVLLFEKYLVIIICTLTHTRVCTCMCVHARVCVDMHVQVRGQLSWVCFSPSASFLPLSLLLYHVLQASWPATSHHHLWCSIRSGMRDVCHRIHLLVCFCCLVSFVNVGFRSRTQVVRFVQQMLLLSPLAGSFP